MEVLSVAGVVPLKYALLLVCTARAEYVKLFYMHAVPLPHC